MYDKKRGKAYREIRAGLRYHKGEKLSLITIGFQRGSAIDCRILKQKIFTWIKRAFGVKVDYLNVEVWECTESTKGDTSWRVHMHMIWNAPYIKQCKILEKVQSYIGESAHVHINLLDGDDKRAAKYLMQYLGNQRGLVYYNKSRDWLPRGYNHHWRALKRDFYKHPKVKDYRSLTGDEDYILRASQCDDTWRVAVLIDSMNAYIDECREKPINNKQGFLYDYEI